MIGRVTGNRPHVVGALKAERANVASAIANLESHLKELRHRLDALDTAISNLEPLYESRSSTAMAESGLTNVGALMSAIGVTPGITDAVREVYRSNGADSFLSPINVRDALKQKGLMKGYDNEMAVVHQVIKRLQYQGQIEAHPLEKTHRWITQRSPSIRVRRGPIPPRSGTQK